MSELTRRLKALNLSRAAVSVDQVRVIGTGPAAGAGGDQHVARVRVLLQVPAPAGRHGAQLRPAQIAGLGGGGVRGDHEHRRAHAVSREDRVGALVAVEAAVVERDQDRPVRELRDVAAGEARVLSDRDRVEAVAGQHRHLARELRLGDRVGLARARNSVDPVVEEDRNDAAIVVDGRVRGGGRRAGAPDRECSQGKQSRSRQCVCDKLRARFLYRHRSCVKATSEEVNRWASTSTTNHRSPGGGPARGARCARPAPGAARDRGRSRAPACPGR